jgi:hypothetical protein
MSAGADLQNLQRQRQHEWSLLRSQISAFGKSVERDISPAHWVGEHPYIATAGAALAGFVAAQIPGKSSPPAPAAVVLPPVIAPLANARGGNLLGMVADLVLAFFQSQAPSRDISFTIANAGTVAGPAFPESFAPPAKNGQ